MERIGYTAVTPTLDGFVADAGQVVQEQDGSLTTAFGTPLEAYEPVRATPTEAHEPETPLPTAGPAAAQAPPPQATVPERVILENAHPYPNTTTALGLGSIGQGEHAVEAFHGLFLPDAEVEMALTETGPEFAVVTAITGTEDSQRKGRSRRYRRFNGAFDHKLTLEELLELLGDGQPAQHSADDESWHSTFHVVSGPKRLPPAVVRMLARSLNASSLLTGGLLTTAALKLAQRRNTGTNRRGGRTERRKGGSKGPRAILFSQP